MPPQTQNRRDLLQAYRLMTQRTALALIAGEPDSANQPLRRRNTATVSGVLVGVIACAVFGVIGMLSPGPKNGLTAAGTLVIDKDTATAYVPCDNSKELCPALNYASALLALNSGKAPAPTTISQAQLAGYKIGPVVGIAGLPQDLPTSSNLIKGPWSVCIDNNVTTLVGGASVGGTPLTTASAELVTSQGQDYVLWNGTRMRITNNFKTVLWPQAPVENVSQAWLNTIPEGPAFAPPYIAGSGGQVHGPAGFAKVGQVYSALTASGPQNFALGQDGKLDPLSELQATLLEDQPGAPKPQQIASSTASANVGSPIPLNGLPSTLPKTPQLTSPACVTYGAGMSRTITTGGTIPPNATGTGNGSPTTVDRVWLPAGRGALIGTTADASSASAPVTSWSLLVGATRYGLARPGVASDFGYNLKTDQVVLPAALVDVLPQGKALDPYAAAQAASG